MATDRDDTHFEPPHAASSTDHVLTELQLYGYRPFQDEPDPRPLPEGNAIGGAVSDIFDALIATLHDTRLEPDLEWVPGARPDHPGAEHGGDPAAALERRVPGVGEPRIEPDGARGRAGRDGGVDHPPQAAPCASSTSSGMSKFA